MASFLEKIVEHYQLALDNIVTAPYFECRTLLIGG